MEVVLQENFPSLGYVGDKVNVKPGYARNYLLPRGIAIESSSGNAKLLRHRLAIVEAKKAKLKAQAQEEAKKFEGLILEFNLKIGEKGKSFGSVSLKDIEKSFSDKGFTLDRQQLELREQIKAGGDYTVYVTLHSEVTVRVTARVIVERVEKKSERDTERKGRRRSKSEDSDEALANSEEGSEQAAGESAENSDSGTKTKKVRKPKNAEESNEAEDL